MPPLTRVKTFIEATGLEGHVWEVRLGSEPDAAARGELATNRCPARSGGGHQIIEDAIDDIFVEGRGIPEAGEVKLHGFGFDAPLIRHIRNVQAGGVRLAGDGAQGAEFRVIQTDRIIALGIAIGERFQRGGVRRGGEPALRAPQQSDGFLRAI